MDYEDMLDKAEDELPDDADATARFEVPEAETRKDGSKTVVTNFAGIADACNRGQEHLSKFLLDELGTAGHVEGSELILKGSFRRGVLNDKLEAYVDRFVTCDECNRPDTRIVKEKGVELLKCEACGARHPIED